MPINVCYNEETVIKAVAQGLDDFYNALITKVDKLNIKNVIRSKNPYLFRAKAVNGAAQIVEAILSAFVSSSEETIFGNAIFEPVATAAGQGNKALAEGIDIMAERGNTVYAIAVKSGTKVFNAASRKKQEQNFLAAQKLAQQAKKVYVPIIGYGYGKKSVRTKKFYQELAGQTFWAELTGDEQFYIKLIRFMRDLPEKYIERFEQSYQKASNRLVKEFTNEFCLDDGGINWEKLVAYNSGK
ncbi:MAG: cytoplasmic protein [Clostridia bacterium]|nr:cytoplasmic protein [Clostridia bacterium]